MNKVLDLSLDVHAQMKPRRTLLCSSFRQKADRWVRDDLGPCGFTSLRTRLRGRVGRGRIVDRAIPCSCFRQKADRWVEEDLGPSGSTSWRTRLRNCLRPAQRHTTFRDHGHPRPSWFTPSRTTQNTSRSLDEASEKAPDEASEVVTAG